MTTAGPKLLCLHGFLQNAKVFSEKSSGIRKLLKKAGIQTDYIDGPVVLERKDLPFEMDDDKWQACLDANVNRAWFSHSEISKELDLSDSIKYVSEYIAKNGPYDGIIAFSQGAALATIITNQITTLVPTQPQFKVSVIISGYSFTEPDPEHPGQLRITEKFVKSFTPNPERTTKMLFIYGSSDQAVPCQRSKYLYNIYENSNVKDNLKAFEHDGGHMVPNKKGFLRPIVEEISEALKD
ncbi:probable Family of serine hydrolases 1 [Saccharomycodes ludwigii]|uniref:Probable Family of serine hydrolases 1 n=1 Tax=Saccharomycodes ludwigii TaxID=36035 RepID=A0A376BBK1_9ASCO|nr:hypothetical protein SCDLUD_004438 [Saccharomycodes ludwigii]KAH3899017.1 hypothetical protein SCDLUD_004438 [Saccharomycodes ludwigii]SSD61924.1 probable Family of serine hydrolases 1 [Saccharomycodes ludwigii]